MSSSDAVKVAADVAVDPREEEIAALRADLIDRRQKRVRLAQLEAERNAEIAAAQAAALTADAEQRLVAIKRAIGGLVDAGQADDARFVDAAQKYATAAQTLNERFNKIVGLRHEARALCEAFGWQVPDLAQVRVPASRPGVMEAFVIVNRVGVRDNGYVKELTDNLGRRSFEEPELAGTDGRALIKRKLGR